ASSQFFDKKNYGFETQLPDGENNNVSLLGMPAENDWILHGPYSDKSLIRNALTMQIGRDMMDYASRTKFCEVVINGNYRGVYLLMEKIKRDENRVDIATLRPADTAGDELTGGYIFQLDRDDEITEDDGWYSPHGSNPYYAYHSPNYRQLMPVQRQYMENWMTNFEQAMLQPTFSITYENYIDVNSFIDYFLINELAKHIDAFKLSFYMYKQKDSNGGKLHFGPIWDFNLGYGNFDFGCDEAANGWIYLCTSRAFWLNKIIGISSVRDRMHCRWQTLRQDELNTNTLLNRIDSLVTELGPAVEQNFTQFDVLGQYLWPNSFVGNTHTEEIDFLKSWLIQRLNWMDNNMYGNPNFDCDELVSVNELPLAQQLEVYPNPFKNQITFSLKNESVNDGEVLIFNTLGHLVTRFELSQKQTLNQQSLPTGLYFYEYRRGKQLVQQGKLVKQ
ncbi:MAG: CotH kinase family protein, partial [Saprospiraceae bacterium]